MSKSTFVLLVFASIVTTSNLLGQSDACPTWNKKQAKTSTNYAALSKRSASDNASDFSKPKYQSIYAKNTATTATSRRGRAVATEENSVTAKAEKRITTIPEQKNTSSKATRTPIIEETTEERPTIKEEKTTKIETKSEAAPIVLNEPTPTDMKASGKGKEKTAAAIKKEKQAEAAKSSQQKQQRKAAVRKLRIGKKKATDCPDF